MLGIVDIKHMICQVRGTNIVGRCPFSQLYTPVYSAYYWICGWTAITVFPPDFLWTGCCYPGFVSFGLQMPHSTMFSFPPALINLKEQVKAIRDGMMQIKLTLDLFTGKQKGLCKAQKDSCCFSFPDKYQSVNDVIEHMKTVTLDVLQDLGAEPVLWYSSWKLIPVILINFTMICFGIWFVKYIHAKLEHFMIYYLM